FGTLHEADPGFFDSLSPAVHALRQSQVLFVEERQSDSKVLNPPPLPSWNVDKWQSVLSEKQETIFDKFVSKASDSSYFQMDPTRLVLTTSRLFLVNFCQTASNFKGLMDHHIENVAISQGKDVYSLDKNQDDMLSQGAKMKSDKEDSLLATYAIQFMKNMLEDDTADCNVINDYRKGDLNYQFEKDISSETDQQTLMVERNSRWVGILTKDLNREKCFVAVGYRHLFYKQGLIESLRRLGFTVSPVPIFRKHR
ncbi:MAG: TraB/GumN family protein, partial [Sphingobacteriales bacterium]